MHPLFTEYQKSEIHTKNHSITHFQFCVCHNAIPSSTFKSFFHCNQPLSAPPPQHVQRGGGEGDADPVEAEAPQARTHHRGLHPRLPFSGACRRGRHRCLPRRRLCVHGDPWTRHHHSDHPRTNACSLPRRCSWRQEASSRWRLAIWNL